MVRTASAFLSYEHCHFRFSRQAAVLSPIISRSNNNIRPLLIESTQAHVCISNTSRAGAELGYDVSVLADGIGDRDIPGASAKQLVEVCFVRFSLRFFLVGCKGSLSFFLSLSFLLLTSFAPFRRRIDYAGGAG